MSGNSDKRMEIRRANRATIDKARSLLPQAPLRIEDSATLSQFEVVLGYNLDPPYRYAQEIFWLEVLARDPKEALQIATEWVTRADGEFEVSDMVRRSSPHERSLGVDHEGKPLKVNWSLPVSAEMPAHSLIRDPMTGFRVGFLAVPELEERWLPEEGRGRYRLVVRKPTSTADPVCLAPIVIDLAPVKIST